MTPFSERGRRLCDIVCGWSWVRTRRNQQGVGHENLSGSARSRSLGIFRTSRGHRFGAAAAGSRSSAGAGARGPGQSRPVAQDGYAGRSEVHDVPAAARLVESIRPVGPCRRLGLARRGQEPRLRRRRDDGPDLCEPQGADRVLPESQGGEGFVSLGSGRGPPVSGGHPANPLERPGDHASRQARGLPQDPERAEARAGGARQKRASRFHIHSDSGCPRHDRRRSGLDGGRGNGSAKGSERAASHPEGSLGEGLRPYSRRLRPGGGAFRPLEGRAGRAEGCRGCRPDPLEAEHRGLDAGQSRPDDEEDAVACERRAAARRRDHAHGADRDDGEPELDAARRNAAPLCPEHDGQRLQGHDQPAVLRAGDGPLVHRTVVCRALEVREWPRPAGGFQVHPRRQPEGEREGLDPRHRAGPGGRHLQPDSRDGAASTAQKATFKPEINGEVEIKPITDTTLSYVANSPTPIIEVAPDSWYAC